jgi:DNA-binding NarL/FixJ family response regulator/predicted ATPase
MAVYSVLRELAFGSSVLIAIDDVPWLDRASADALEFALRRIEPERLGLLACRRLAENRDRMPLEPVTAAAQVVRLGPLSLGATHELVKGRLGYPLPRPVLLRVHEAAEGNPFYALEVARLVLEAGVGPGQQLPVPGDVLQLVGRRIRRLRGVAAEALLVAAAAAQPTLGLIGAAVGVEGESALTEAEEAGIVELDGEGVRFSHPLYAAAVYSLASSQRRRRVHRRLGEVAIDEEERARHLALTARGADEGIAAALEEAAAGVAARAAPAAAVELMELACELTPATDTAASCRRQIVLAELSHRGGAAARAGELLEDAIAHAEPGNLRARARVTLATVLHSAGTPSGAVELCEEALAETDDPELQALIHTVLAQVGYDDFRRADHHARSALALLETLSDPDPALYSQALLAFCQLEVEQGRPLPAETVRRGLELEQRAKPVAVADRFSAALGAWLKYRDDFDGARHWLEATYRSAVEEGDDGSLPYALSHLPQLELWSGNWSRAEEFARAHLDLAEQTAQESQRRQARFNLALVHAHQGRVVEARAEIAENLAAAREDGDRWTTWTTLRVLGFLELSLGDAAEAARQLQMAADLRAAIGDHSSWHEPDQIESLLAIGEPEAAAALLERFEARARAISRHSALANAARCEALLAGTVGDSERALEALDKALAEHKIAPIPFDTARSMLAKGRLERRAKHKAAAKESLEAARSTFDELGAPLWAKQAREELERIGLRRAGDDLTENERRVAELAASGLTNRQVAAELFMSPKTVEANLARAYRKLGIHSRAELGARLGGEQASAQT